MPLRESESEKAREKSDLRGTRVAHQDDVSGTGDEARDELGLQDEDDEGGLRRKRAGTNRKGKTKKSHLLLGSVCSD